MDWSGRISKCGDAMLRMYLFEAAGGDPSAVGDRLKKAAN
jgi:hypothetical protein